MEEIMSIETVSRVGAAAYHGGTVAQAKPVEAAQPVEKEQAAAVYQSVSQAQPKDKGFSNGFSSNEKSVEKDNEKIQKAVNDLNRKMENTSCRFGVHEGTGRITIKIVDKETDEVLKEYPAEETLEMIEKVWELAGIMVDKKL